MDDQSITPESTLFILFFRLAMWWRIVYGALKMLFGVALLRWATIDPAGLFYKLMSHEIIEDPGDLLIRIATPLVEHLSTSTTVFIALYLLFWGGVDVILSANILRHKLWAFPTALILIGVFVSYEIYRASYSHSLILGFIIAIDIFILWLIKKEYGIENNKKKPAK